MLYKWRTIIPGAVYSQGDIGSDEFGDGTMAKPFRSLRRTLALNPTTIVCAGRFSEDMADGNHVRIIRGDYLGAATFDGNDEYLVYGYTLINIVVKNCITGNTQLTVASGSGLFAGAGRASSANAVGFATSVHGVAGSPVILEKTGLYWGVIGGTSAVTKNVFSNLRTNGAYKISLGTSGTSTVIQYNTIHGCRISDRQKRVTTGTNPQFRFCIFADFDLFADEVGVTFNQCLFTSDCKWYYNGQEIVISGATSADRLASLVSGMDTLSVPVEDRPTLSSCVFSSQTASEIFNNPNKSDWTIKPGSDADADIQYGALPVALNIPILDNSNGVPQSWDENTAGGCITVLNDAIMIDEFSGDLDGRIMTKIIEINPLTTSIKGLFTMFTQKFQQIFARLSINPSTIGVFLQNEVLDIGRYSCEGGVTYNSQTYSDNTIIEVTASDTTFSDVIAGSKLHKIGDLSNFDTIYIRESPKINTEILSSEGLEDKGVYYNFGSENITYRGRTIIPGESFVAENNVDTFTSSPSYKIGVLFDDTRAPVVPWIPAQLFGEYFSWRQNGGVRFDNRDIPIASGNDLSYQTVANGGYSDVLIKSPLSRRYFQIGLFLKRYRK